jgi:hypothetical protein
MDLGCWDEMKHEEDREAPQHTGHGRLGSKGQEVRVDCFYHHGLYKQTLNSAASLSYGEQRQCLAISKSKASTPSRGHLFFQALGERV